jgi:hypothetical protein
VTSVSPMSGAIGINPCTAVSAYVHVPTLGGVDNATISTTVKLYQVNADTTLVGIDVGVNSTGAVTPLISRQWWVWRPVLGTSS